jgi:hypothetical protein
MARGEMEPAQLIWARCRHTEIVYLPLEDLPKCLGCGAQLILEELLDEGKSY